MCNPLRQKCVDGHALMRLTQSDELRDGVVFGLMLQVRHVQASPGAARRRRKGSRGRLSVLWWYYCTLPMNVLVFLHRTEIFAFRDVWLRITLVQDRSSTHVLHLTMLQTAAGTCMNPVLHTLSSACLYTYARDADICNNRMYTFV